MGMFQVLMNSRSGIVLSLILASAMLAGCVSRIVSVERVEKLIKEQVPDGSDKLRVKEFIDKLSMDSLKIIRGDFYKPTMQPSGYWDPDRIKELWPRVAELIPATIIDAESGFLNRNDILIEFAIDKDGRMIGYTVKLMGVE